MLSELAERCRLTRDEAIFDLLLDEHVEACETLHRGLSLNIKSGTQTWGLVKPATWTDDHKHLERLLFQYHDYAKRRAIVQAKVRARQAGVTWATVDFRNDYWHLAQWYLLCRRTRVPQWMVGKDGKPRLTKAGERIQVVHNGQPRFLHEVIRGTKDYGRVKGGLGWLERAWERSVRPVLGREPRYVAWEKLLEPAA